MGITFGKRKLKIKIIEQKEQVIENEAKEKASVAVMLKETPEVKINKSVLKVKRTFKDTLKELTKFSTEQLHLSDFTVYQYFFSDSRYQFQKISGDIFLTEITLEKYLSIPKPTVIRRATGLAETKEYRSRLVLLCRFENKDYIFMWSSILYEAFDEELIKRLQTLLTEMRE